MSGIPLWVVALLALKVGDFTTTELVLARGGVELYPGLSSRAARVVAVPAAVGAVYFATRALERDGHRRWAKGIRVLSLVVAGYAIAHNLRELRGRPP